MARLSADIQAHVGTFWLDVAFEMQGDTTAVLGASGAGKTLTLRAIAGLLHPTGGRIALGDKAVFDPALRLSVPARQRNIGYVFQDYALFPHLTVVKNLAYALHGWDKASRAARIQELVDLLDLSGLERRLPGEISGGQQQRVALGRALAPGPDLILLDEPFSAVDAPARSVLTEQLQALQERLDFAMLLVTHDVSEAYALASQLVLLDQGRVIQQGPREDVFHTPASAGAARLLGFRNLLPGQVVGRDSGNTAVDVQGVRVYGTGGGLSCGTFVICGIRPQSIGLVPDEDVPPDDQGNLLPVTVVQRTDRGVRSEVTLAVNSISGNGPLLHAEVDPSALHTGLVPGARWKAVIPQQAVRLWPADQKPVDPESTSTRISM
jgi:molybdate transport system ATP-binding protein